MLDWSAQPFLFRAAAVLTGIFAVVMSLIPVLAYGGMAPVIQWDALLREVVWRCGPILLFYVFAFATATLLDPSRRPVAGAVLLTTTLPVAVTLMLYGLR